mmetsp:Transcript_703/g.1594  ORF Transcript_703/g.1594 Transcript_703/m.1594 type:complete len:90 (+) Transcript_703:119-388(+)
MIGPTQHGIDRTNIPISLSFSFYRRATRPRWLLPAWRECTLQYYYVNSLPVCRPRKGSQPDKQAGGGCFLSSSQWIGRLGQYVGRGLTR